MEESIGNIKVSIWRSDAAGGAYREYDVPGQESQTVFDAVTWVQRILEPLLAHCFACRVGMCRPCAMTDNRIPRWTCCAHVQNVLADNRMEIASLRNLPVVKDLVTDMADFFEKWICAEGRFYPTAMREDPIAPISIASPECQAVSAGIECIYCGVCCAACDSVETQAGQLGPAALNRAWTLVNDERDGGQAKRPKAVAGYGGCHHWHSQEGYRTHCPNELNTILAIAGLKRFTARLELKGEL